MNGTVSLALKKWNPTTLLRDRRMIIVGKPGTGKSAAALDVMEHIKNIDSGIIFSPTDKFTGHWEEFCPRAAVHYEYSPSVVSQLIKSQENIFNQTYMYMLRKAKLEGRRITKKDVEIPPVFIICDDCLAENVMTKDVNIREIFMNGRHLKIFLLITAQWLMDIKISQRQLVDYLLICSTDDPTMLKRVFDNFFSSYFSYPAFCDIVADVTENYGILVLDRTNMKSKKMEDHVFWWEAKLHDPGSFKIGGPEYWNYCDSQYYEKLGNEKGTGLKIRNQKTNSQPRIRVTRKG